MSLGFLGKVIGAGLNYAESRTNRKLSERYARKRIQLTVADAKKAGIHPYYALGGSSSGFSIPSHSGAGDLIGSAFADLDNEARRKAPKVDGLDAEQQRAQIDLLKAQRHSIEQEMILATQARAPTKTAIPKLGEKGNPYPMTVWMETNSGDLVKVTNPDLVRGIEESASGPILLAEGQTYSTKPPAKEKPKPMPKSPKDGQLTFRNGRYYKYDAKSQQWKLSNRRMVR